MQRVQQLQQQLLEMVGGSFIHRVEAVAVDH
jgi:hypothetical protein